MKEWTCEHCVKKDTDACYMGYIVDGYKYCQDDILVDKDVAYEQGRAEAIEEIKEHYKPCNDCGACLEYDREYFKKGCELDTRIQYTELCEYLEELKEKI